MPLPQDHRSDYVVVLNQGNKAGRGPHPREITDTSSAILETAMIFQVTKGREAIDDLLHRIKAKMQLM